MFAGAGGNVFNFLRRLFSRKTEERPDEDSAVNEFWKIDFRHPEKARFKAEDEDSYSTSFGKDGYLLSCKHKGVFAWAVDPLYRYSNFVIEACIRFPDKKTDTGYPFSSSGQGVSAGASCAGFLFRYLNDSTFYSVFVSELGLVRMDAVINGTPVPVLGWTGISAPQDPPPFPFGEGGETPYADPSVYFLRVIVQRTSFTVVLNDRWIAECEDEMIQASGKIAFAAQNWNSADISRAVLQSFSIESRPVEVEVQYTRWNQYIKIPASARIALAQTKYAMGQYPAALIELKKAWKIQPPESGDYLFASQICLVQGLYPEAEDYARRAAEEAKKASDAVLSAKAEEELGGILYAKGDFSALTVLLERIPQEVLQASPFLLNLAGHEAFRGGKFAEAAESYKLAAARMPSQPLFRFHAGNALAAAGKTEEAVENWLSAASDFLRESDFADLEELFPKLEEAAPDDVRVICLGAKYFYAAGNFLMLDRYLPKLEKIRSDDSALWYILGLRNAGKGNADKALQFYQRAVELEPDFAPYRFKVAENLFNRNLDYRQALDDALRAGPEDGWIRNLSALAALREGNLEKAAEEIAAARKALPEEKTILVNAAEVARRQGKLDEALSGFDEGDADLLYAGANLLADDGRYEEADEWYLKACKKMPHNAELLADRAANCMEMDLLNEADDLLGRALEIQKSPRVYRLIGVLAVRKGEYARAEVALLSAMAEFPDDVDLIYDLSGVYVTTGRAGKAAELEKELRRRGRDDLADSLAGEILEKASTRIVCASCGRQWFVPKNIPPQGRLSITGQPPDELPAGKCPKCGDIFCIGCAREFLDDTGRFHCAHCNAALKLSDPSIIWILSNWQKESGKAKKR